MRRYLTLLAVAGLALTFASPCEAGAGHSTLKPKKPPSSGGSQAGGGQPAALNTHAHQAAADARNRIGRIAAERRELDGNFKVSDDRADKLPPFDLDWTRDNIGQKLITLEEGTSMAPLRSQIVAELLARGISVRPSPSQLAALKTFLANPPPQDTMNRELFEYSGDIAANRGYRNTQIEQRAGNYESVPYLIGPDEYASLLDHNGPISTNHADRYTPATAPFEH